MIAGPDKGTGRLSVALEVANYRDLIAADIGVLELARVRRARIRGVVDTGVSHLALPGKTIKELGWKPKFPKLQDIVSTAWEWHQKHPRGYVD